MCTETISVIFSGIVSLAAVTATIVSTVITSSHNYKMRVVEFTSDGKLHLYQEFFDVMNDTLAAPTFDLEHALALRKIFSKVYLVCDNQTREQLDRLQKYIYKSPDVSNVASSSEYKMIYDLITVAMREDLKSLRQ